MFVFALAFAPCSLAQDDPQAIAAQEFDDLRAKRDALIGDVIGLDPIRTLHLSDRYEAASRELPPRPGTSFTLEAEDHQFEASNQDVERAAFHSQLRFVNASGAESGRFAGNGYVVWDSPSPIAGLALDPEFYRISFATRFRVEAALVRGPEFGRACIRLRANTDDESEEDRFVGQLDFEGYSAVIEPSGFLTVGEFDWSESVSLYFGFHVTVPTVAAPGASGSSFGLDRLRITVVGDEGDWLTALERVAVLHGLDPARLVRFVSITGDSGCSGWLQSVWPVEPRSFGEALGDWEERGFAFGDDRSTGRRGLLRQTTREDAPLHSGLDSERLVGALVSKPHRIDANFVLAAVKGVHGRVVVVPAGAPARSVPFESIEVAVDGGDVWSWRVLDVRPLRGRLARIEVRDDGGGWIAIREVVLSDESALTLSRRFGVGCGSRSVETPEEARSWLEDDQRFVFSDSRFHGIEVERQAIEARLEASQRR